jgi:hypothetical protein
MNEVEVIRGLKWKNSGEIEIGVRVTQRRPIGVIKRAEIIVNIGILAPDIDISILILILILIFTFLINLKISYIPI